MEKRISVIIPHYPYGEEIDKLLKRCVESLRAYEIIVVVNDKIGFPKAVNQGLKVASGDYLCVVNNDLYLKEGKLEDLAVDGICSPSVRGNIQAFYGCWFCFPRWVYEQLGGLNEEYGLGDFEDFDFMQRAKEAGIRIRQNPNVEVDGDDSKTWDFIGGRNEHQLKNREIFKKRWGAYPDYEFTKSFKLDLC